MKHSIEEHSSRRQFIMRAGPACALAFAGLTKALGIPASQSDAQQENRHKFDNDYAGPLTYRRLYFLRARSSVQVAQACIEAFGREEVLEILKKNTSERGTLIGRMHLENCPDSSLRSFGEMFRNPEDQAFQRFLTNMTWKIVEDTEKAIEIRVTECIWAEVYREIEAGDIGFARVCYADYAWPTAFNPRMSLVRDKTLMQGHDCCNHRYIWTK